MTPHDDPARVRIELYGVPRLRAGKTTVDVRANSVAEALEALASACPDLAPSVVDAGALSPAYLIAINGTQFDDDPATRLRDGDVLVLLSAQAGG
ncbi:MAG: MoaD/ThiS family protein [Polyangiaceae bacterium]